MTDPGVILVAELHGLVGRRPELEQLLADLAASARADPACTSYHMASLEGSGEFLLVAGWQDEHALRRHYDSDAYARYRNAVGPLLARPSDVVLHRVSSTIHARDPNPPEPGMFG
jgi:quinol monooxygenase YgiN